MNVIAKRWIALEASQFFVKGLKGILCLFIGVILLSLSFGVLKMGWDLYLSRNETLEVILRRIIIDALILLAVVEVFRTVLAYFTEGRVKVTFIVDTVLVVMLTEVISLWFKGADWERFSSIALLVLTLGLMRVIAIRYSPALRMDRPGETFDLQVPNPRK
jgi:uncharacterized membrane protein (DUF373 family)